MINVIKPLTNGILEKCEKIKFLLNKKKKIFEKNEKNLKNLIFNMFFLPLVIIKKISNFNINEKIFQNFDRNFFEKIKILILKINQKIKNFQISKLKFFKKKSEKILSNLKKIKNLRNYDNLKRSNSENKKNFVIFKKKKKLKMKIF